MFTMNITQSLEIKCAEVGTNLTEVCRLAGVDRSVLARWKNQEPKTIRTLRRLETVIDQMRSQRNEGVHIRQG